MNSEIDLSFPPETSPDGTGNIHSTDGRHEMNIFHLRLSLAHIEAKVYHLLYSSRSRKVDGSELEKRVASLQAMLDSWYGASPCRFSNPTCRIDGERHRFGTDNKFVPRILPLPLFDSWSLQLQGRVAAKSKLAEPCRAPRVCSSNAWPRIEPMQPDFARIPGKWLAALCQHLSRLRRPLQGD